MRILPYIFFLFINAMMASDYPVLQDSFNYNKDAWYEGNTQSTRCKIEKGHYYLQKKNGGSIWVYHPLSQLDANREDFTIEVRLRQLSGSSKTGFGLMVGLHADKSAYTKFLINAAGQLKIDNYYNNSGHIKHNYSPHNAIAKGPTYNHLKVVKKANTLYYYVNDSLVAYNADNGSYGNRIAFFMGGKMEIEIDHIHIFKRNSCIKLIDQFNNDIKKIKLSSKINSQYQELAPVLSADGQSMYICRYEHPANIGGNDIWVSQKDSAGNWGELIQVNAPLNNKGHNFVVSVAPDHNSMLLANSYHQDGSAAGNGLSITYRKGDQWVVPQKLNIDYLYNKNKFVSYFLCPDNKTLLLSLERNDGYGIKDLYVSFRSKDNRWSAPRNMGPSLNTFENEVNPFMYVDNKTLFFASQGHAGYGRHDLFVSERLDDSWTKWSTPKNLGPAINGSSEDFSIYMDAAAEWAYLSCGGDIYKIENPVKPNPVILIRGNVYNKKTMQPMGVNILYQNLTIISKAGQAKSDPATGAYQIALPAGNWYGYAAQKENFYAISNAIDLRKLKTYEERVVNLYLDPIETNKSIVLNNIFFEFDKAVLQKISNAELDKLYGFLQQNPGLKIQIEGHTDRVGTEVYNLNLSQKRAAAVVAYLMKKGIASERLIAIGYGETQPIDKQNDVRNRRVAFRILKED